MFLKAFLYPCINLLKNYKIFANNIQLFKSITWNYFYIKELALLPALKFVNILNYNYFIPP